MRFGQLTSSSRRDRELPFSNSIMEFLRRDMSNLFGGNSDNLREVSNIFVNVKNEENQIIVFAEVPGINEEELSLSLEGNVLTIKVEKKEEKEQKESDFYLKEYTFGTSSRSLQLPFQVNQSDIQAELDKGILEIRIPKPQNNQVTSNQITINKKP